MAYAVQLTISTGNKVSLNYQSQEVAVTLCYQLERDDNDLMQVVEEKSAEVANAHRKAWSRIRDEKLRETHPQVEQPIQSQTAEVAPLASTVMQMTGDQPVGEPQDEVQSSTQPQQVAVCRLLECSQLNDVRVSEMAQIPFSSSDLHKLNKGQATQILLVLQRHEREKAQAARASQT